MWDSSRTICSSRGFRCRLEDTILRISRESSTGTFSIQCLRFQECLLPLKLLHTHGWTEIDIPGKTHSEAWGSTLVLCSEGYFNAVGQQLITGRFLSQDDVDSGRKVALVNQALARSYFGSEDPVGREIRFPPHETVPDWPRKTYFDIIGVVKDAKNHGLEDPARPEAYVPYTVTAAGPRGLLVKTTVQSDFILPAFHRAVTGVDSDVVVVEASSIATSLDQNVLRGTSIHVVCAWRFRLLRVVTCGSWRIWPDRIHSRAAKARNRRSRRRRCSARRHSHYDTEKGVEPLRNWDGRWTYLGCMGKPSSEERGMGGVSI